jgi:hypothetical protein
VFALFGCYVVIAFGVAGLVSRFVESGTTCSRCGAPDGLTSTSRWLLAGAFGMAWPFLCAVVLVELAELIKRR